MAFNAGDIEAKLTLDRTPFNIGLDQAKADADDFAKREFKAKLDADERPFQDQLDKAEAEGKRFGSSTYTARLGADTSGVDKSTKDTQRALDDTKKKAEDAGKGGAAGLLPIAIALGLMPAAAVAVGASIAAIPVAFGVVAGLLSKSNDGVASAFKGTWQGISKQLQADVLPLAGTFQTIAYEANAAFQNIAPDIQQAFASSGPSIQLFSRGIEGLITNLMPGFQSAIGASLPAISGLNNLLASTGSGISQFFITMSTQADAAGQGMTLFGNLLHDTLMAVGTLLAQLTAGWASIGPMFTQVWNQLLNTITRFTSTAIPAFVSGFHLILDAVSPLLNLIQPLIPLIGSLGGSIGVFYSTAKLLQPAVSGLGGAISTAGEKLSTMSGIAGVGGKVLGGLGTVVEGVGKSLPLIGIGIGIFQGAWEAAFGTMDQAKNAMDQGGQAAMDMSGRLVANSGVVQGVSSLFGSWAGDLLSNFIPTQEKVTAQLKAQYDALSTVQQLQADATVAQNNYNSAVATYGKTSPQAQDALNTYRSDLINVTNAQDDETKALQTTMDKESEQINQLLGVVGAQLNWQKALQGVKNDQDAVTKAIQQHGAASDQAASAENTYQSSILNVVQAAGKLALAQDANDTKAGQAAAATNAEISTILGLAAAAGDHAPPALQQLVAGLSDAEISAYTSTGAIDGTKQAIVHLPGGKDITINVNSNGQAVVNQTQAAMDSILPVTNKYLDFYVNTIINPTQGGSPGLVTRAAGGEIAANVPTLVGEHGPELIFPNRSGYVATNAESRQMMTGHSGGSGPSGTGDWESIGRVMANMVASAIAGSTFRVDGSGLARLVNDTNLLAAGR